MLLHDLAQNLLGGLRLAGFRPVSSLDFRVRPAQYAALVAFEVLLSLAGAAARAGFVGRPDLTALPYAVFEIPLILLAGLLIATLSGKDAAALGVPVAVASAEPIFEVLSGVQGFLARDLLAGRPTVLAGLSYLLLGWWLAVTLRCLALYVGHAIRRLCAGSLIFAVVVVAPSWYVGDHELWIPGPEDRAGGAGDEDLPSIAEEEHFHGQPRVLEETLAALKPGRPGVEDLYFVGFAPYADQDVFMKEMRVVRALFDERFDTAGRSIALVNNRKTLTEAPLATATNLGVVLRHVGKLMNPEEDVLFLFLTSHGSQTHELAVEFSPLDLQPITPALLRRLLIESAIKWKVVVVSACYSGGFVEPLRDAETLIMTASDADHTSFGCGTEEDFTYFGRAYFDEQLRSTHSFVEAFLTARKAIAAREQAENLTASNPQIYVGAAIQRKLAALEARLRGQTTATLSPLRAVRLGRNGASRSVSR